MNRGSWDGRPIARESLECFNEAPIHESGKSDSVRYRSPAQA